MLKRILFILAFLTILPVFSGEYEDALHTGNPVFLYLYTPDCGYCNQFNPLYEKISKSSFAKDYVFLKINANTKNGTDLMHIFNAQYVPFVAVVDAKRQIMSTVPPICLLNSSCMEKELKTFLK